MKKVFFILACLINGFAFGQQNLDYQKPPQEIIELVDIQRAPWVLLNEDKDYMLLIYRDQYKSIEDLSKNELRLAGLRIDPKTNIGSRTTYYNNIQVKDLTKKESQQTQVSGLPANAKLSNFSWSPDQTKMAMTNTVKEGVELWVLDLETASIKKLTDASINANMGYVLNWFEDGNSLLVKMISAERSGLIDTRTVVPTGPTISVNEGKKAQNRTYQDLLKNKNDEYNFEQLALSELYKIGLDGSKNKWSKSSMYHRISFSPDGNYVMVTSIDKPFSYLVPYRRFPSNTSIYDKEGNLIEVVSKVPLIEDLPKGFMAVREGKREFGWRNDKPSTLVYVKALDKGDPEVATDHRDEVFQLDAPFKGEGQSVLKTENRFYNLFWGNDDIAIAYDYWWNTRNMKTYVFDPSDNTKQPKKIFDRNYQDQYSDPGDFVMKRNDMGSEVLALSNGSAYLLGDGYTEKGQFPFLDQMDLNSGDTKRLYVSEMDDKVESLQEFDPKTKQLVVRIESPSAYPNFFFRSLKKNKLTQLTFNENPFKSITGGYKEVIKYKRDDGLELSGTLYLPVGYDMEQKEKLPLLIWAYPEEFKDRSSAGQNIKNQNKFTYPSYGSMIYWITQGYAVLDDASFPIIGEGEEEPNDTFRSQLVANAKAAIDAVDALGFIDRNRVAVGGHSYGAFMVANLLAHSDLFAAGIARSGAYNRTLTPFGFQREERNYWEAPDVYYTMSPFMHAEKVNEPILLVHGEADNNSGTYPMQSERYFNALKGLGATARLVILPKESHGYRAKESILHVLWEQDQWLDKYVKNRKEPSSME
ncbi:alpha/beta fold hydrolase [Lutimonas saemankumensis]|uniref:S9 family peptidase n=1 Tax=Lutimonas saemankumensis TaxID=483016 RepID=UPI001CD5D159|nr:prolyl oligopeptidase family serine peptidase [Lutimonas saemankumensis]MCA0933287.1 alpha/beta fold hydrolase [Lutimonas saemankumensis]